MDFKGLGYFLAFLTVALLSGCGSKMTPLGTAAQNSFENTSSECSLFDSVNIRLRGKIMSYMDNVSFQDDLVRVRLQDLLSEFDSNPQVYIKFFRWSSTAGTRNYDSNPLTFTVQYDVPSRRPISGNMTQIDSSIVTQLRANAGIPGTTSVDFFNNTAIVLQGVNYNWKAVQIVVYTGNVVSASADMLIPAFHANPNIYGLTHDGALNSLHPFWNQRGESLTNAQWVARAQSLCF